MHPDNEVGYPSDEGDLAGESENFLPVAVAPALRGLVGQPVGQPIRGLLYSRKFIVFAVVAILALAMMILLVVVGATPDQIFEAGKWAIGAVGAAGTALIGGIAYEDGMSSNQ